MATVLLVEDNEDIREMMSLALQFGGIDVVVARDGREALGLLETGVTPCLILLDLMMPVMSGWEFGAALKRDPKLCAIPVIVVSALTEEMARRLEVVDYIPKPVDIDRLIEVVCEHCC